MAAPPKRPRKPPPRQQSPGAQQPQHQSVQSLTSIRGNKPKPPPKYESRLSTDVGGVAGRKPKDSIDSVGIPDMDNVPDMPNMDDGPPLPPSFEQLQTILLASESEPNLFASNSNHSNQSGRYNYNNKAPKIRGDKVDNVVPKNIDPRSLPVSPVDSKSIEFHNNNSNSSNNGNNRNNGASGWRYANNNGKWKPQPPQPPPKPLRPSISSHYLEPSQQIEGRQQYSLHYAAIKSLPQNLRVSFSDTKEDSTMTESEGNLQLWDVYETPNDFIDDNDNDNDNNEESVSQIQIKIGSKKGKAKPPRARPPPGRRRPPKSNNNNNNNSKNEDNNSSNNVNNHNKPKAPRRLSKRFAGIEDSRKVVIVGSCQCKSIKYELLEYPMDIQHCYCSMCRKMHGAAVASWCPMNEQDIRWVSRSTLRSYQSSVGVSRQFCSRCGSNVCIKYSFQEDTIWITPSLFDENETNDDNNNNNNENDEKKEELSGNGNTNKWNWSDDASILHIFCSDGCKWFPINDDSAPKLSHNDAINLDRSLRPKKEKWINK